MLGDCRDSLRSLPSASVQSVITSPPYYGLRDYGLPPLAWPDGWCGSHGLEPTPELYLQHEVEIFSEVKRVLRDDGTLWLNLGDSYAGSGKGPTGSNGIGDQRERQGFTGNPGRFATSTLLGGQATNLHQNGRQPWGAGYKPKDLMLLPFRVAMALQADGWYVRSCIPWLKRNSMPESVTDRPSSAVEYVFLLSKSPRYFWDADAVRVSSPENLPVPGGNAGTIPPGHPTENHPDKHHNGLMNGAGREPSRNRRNSDWFFESWQGLLLDECDAPQALLVNPQPFSGAHFATFPPKLVEPMVKASTSERGQCPECGAAWARETDKQSLSHKPRGYWQSTRAAGHMSIPQHGGTLGVEVMTTGWRATCAHADLEPEPQTVLDPFAGAGTVGLVADRLNRDAVLLDLKPDYHLMASDRVTQDAPLFVQLEAGLFDGDLQPAPDNKQDALGKRTYSGFNARWDAGHAEQ